MMIRVLIAAMCLASIAHAQPTGSYFVQPSVQQNPNLSGWTWPYTGDFFNVEFTMEKVHPCGPDMPNETCDNIRGLWLAFTNLSKTRTRKVTITFQGEPSEGNEPTTRVCEVPPMETCGWGDQRTGTGCSIGCGAAWMFGYPYPLRDDVKLKIISVTVDDLGAAPAPTGKGAPLRLETLALMFARAQGWARRAPPETAQKNHACLSGDASRCSNAGKPPQAPTRSCFASQKSCQQGCWKSETSCAASKCDALKASKAKYDACLAACAAPACYGGCPVCD